MLIADPGSSSTSDLLTLGVLGSGNRLVLTNGGEFRSPLTGGLFGQQGLVVGDDASSTNNRVVVHGGVLRAANTNSDSTLDVRRGTNVFNAGLIDVDLLLLTNTLGRFEFNGGTLITRGAVISNSTTFTVGGSGGVPAVWDVRAGPGSHHVARTMFIGFNTPFTQLIHTNGGFLTNSDFAFLGVNPASRSNSATLAGPASRWSVRGGVAIGDSSSDNRLTVSDGASLVTGDRSFLGIEFPAANNEAVISGPGSSWVGGPNVPIQIGVGGISNKFMVAAGGQATHGVGLLGVAPSGSNNLALITGPGSLWNILDELRVGVGGSANQLVVSNGAVMFTGGLSILGEDTNASGNSVLVTGPGTAWNILDALTVGRNGSGNQLLVTDGAMLTNRGHASLGDEAASRSNSVALGGPSSRWWPGDGVVVGEAGSGNRLVVRDGASLVTASISYLGQRNTSSNNEVVVTGPGSSWFTADYGLRVGYEGSVNRLLVSAGGVVTSHDDEIGAFSSSSNNQVLVTGSGSLWNNTGGLAVGFNSRGNQLVVSNGAAVTTAGLAMLGAVTNATRNSALITGPGSSWLIQPDLFVGSNGAFNQLVISNGARVENREGSIGAGLSSSNNVAMVTGAGSVWSNTHPLYVSRSGAGNQLVVSDGGTVFSSEGIIGFETTGDNNVALVTGPGSSWNLAGDLAVSFAGDANRLVVSNAGRVLNNNGVLVNRSNEVVVTGAGSLWSNRLDVIVGSLGLGNRLVVNNGGTVLGGNVFVGLESTSTNNRVVVDAGTLLVTNAAGVGALDIRRGTNVLNAGVIEADQLLLTNTLGQFEFNGGTLLTRGAAISNAQPFVVGRTGATPAIWDVRAGTNPHVVGSSYFAIGGGVPSLLLITNGALLTSGEGVIGLDDGGDLCQAIVSGPGSRLDVTGDFSVGFFASRNSLVVSNGASVSTVFPVIGVNAGYTNNQAVVTGSNSLWTVPITLIIGSAGSASRTLVTDGGTVSVSNSAIVGVLPAISSNNLLHVASGTFRVLNPGGTGVLDIRSGTNRLDAGLMEVDRLVLTNTRGFFEFNGGTLSLGQLTIANTSGQQLRVGNGVSPATLRLKGDGSHAFGPGGVTVSSNAALTGSGTASGALAIQTGGLLSPGTSIGRLAFTRIIPPTLQGTTLMEISRNGSALTNDVLQVPSVFAYGGSLIVSNAGPDALAAGDRFRLFVAAGYSGAFAHLTLPPLASDLSWQNDLSTDGSISVVVAPSPGFSTISLSGTNLILAGTNGPPNANYTVLAATNVALPLSNWTSIATRQFDAGGGFSFTNTIVPGIPQRFFRLSTP